MAKYLIIVSPYQRASNLIALGSHPSWKSAMAPPSQSDQAERYFGAIPAVGSKEAACTCIVWVIMRGFHLNIHIMKVIVAGKFDSPVKRKLKMTLYSAV